MTVRRGFVLAAALVAGWTAWTLPAESARAAWQPDGVDLTRPRLLFRAEDLPEILDRLEREPYRSLLLAMRERIRQADGIALDDHGIGEERIKSRAAKNLAFLYAVGRNEDGDLATPEEKAAIGRRVHDFLFNMYTRSRLAVPPPLGGWDRDISTSEELLQYATAYDTLLGAGYDPGADGAVLEENIVALASELYDNYFNPATASSFANLHQNNHRSKTGASLVVAAVAVAEHTPEPGSDPRNVREPSVWVALGLDLVDLIMRYALVAGDGAYGEGPFYFRFASENLLPFARAWDRLVGGRDWPVNDLSIPSLWRHPLFRRSLQWQLDMTLPDGSLAPVDDGNPGRSYSFGATSPEHPLAPSFAWRWRNAPNPFESSGNVDLAADSIVASDDRVVPEPPGGSPTAFYLEGGNGILRSDWSEEAVVVFVQGEHDTASQFGLDREGRPVSPQSHEHADPGAFLLHAFGERLMLDPGYFSFGEREMVNQPEHHNTVLVNGVGPVDYLLPSLQWRHPGTRPRVDGHALLADPIDTDFADAVRVFSRYGRPASQVSLVERRFVFPFHRFLVVFDRMQSGPVDPPVAYTTLFHGNGGGEDSGLFERTTGGGRWTREAARVDVLAASLRSPITFETSESVHEMPHGQRSTHTVLRVGTRGELVENVQLVYPSRAEHAPPILEGAETGDGRIRLSDVDAGGSVEVILRSPQEALVSTGDGSIRADGDLLIVATQPSADGGEQILWGEAVRRIEGPAGFALETASAGTIGVSLADGKLEGVVENADAEIIIRNLGFAPQSFDGACAVTTDGPVVRVRLGGERRFVLRSRDGDGRPAADPGTYERVFPESDLVLDGSASCDPEGADLTPRWEIVSAPQGSAWELREAATWNPTLAIDRPGTYRVELVVEDETGNASLPSRAEILAGDRCEDGTDNDRDGLFETDDPDCDAGLRCGGDCTGEGEVTIEEIVRGVAIALGELPLWRCAAADADGDGRVTVDELILALTTALRGCAS